MLYLDAGDRVCSYLQPKASSVPLIIEHVLVHSGRMSCPPVLAHSCYSSLWTVARMVAKPLGTQPELMTCSQLFGSSAFFPLCSSSQRQFLPPRSWPLASAQPPHRHECCKIDGSGETVSLGPKTPALAALSAQPVFLSPLPSSDLGLFLTWNQRIFRI